MSNRMNHIADYFRVKVQSATPMGLIFMVYERAMKSIEEAQEALDTRNRDLFCKKIVHAQDCLRELRTSLNLEIGEIAQSLYRLYDFMIDQLIEANLSRENPGPYLKRVSRMLSDLYRTWKQAEKKLQSQKASSTRVTEEAFSISG